MINLDKYKGFEWDKGNIDKSYEKHGITPNESEEAFLDEEALILRDITHSSRVEQRYILIGKNRSEKLLFVVFTTRGKKIRIISARAANKKEEKQYV